MKSGKYKLYEMNSIYCVEKLFKINIVWTTIRKILIPDPQPPAERTIDGKSKIMSDQ